MKVVYYSLKGIEGIESSYRAGIIAFATVFYDLSSRERADLNHYGTTWAANNQHVELIRREVEEQGAPNGKLQSAS
jgi:hypothetical protein